MNASCRSFCPVRRKTVRRATPFLGRTAIVWLVDAITISGALAYAYISLCRYRVSKAENSTSGKVLGLSGLILSALFFICPVLPGLLSGSARNCPSREVFLDNLGRSLKTISDYAAEKSVDVSIEPVNHLDCPEGLNTWDDAAALLDRYGCDHISLDLDLYHMCVDEPDMLDTIRRYAGRIGSVQLMDRNRQVPGNGDFDFAPILREIKNTGYDGPITMECLPLPDPQTALEKAAAFYHRAFD